MQVPKRVIISGGGTGGHIFPALAIAGALRKIDPDIDILFVGAKGKMEMEKVPNNGYPIIGLWISGFQRSLSLSNLLFPIKLLVSMIKALMILRKFKPSIVIGTGGYASGPVLRAATWLNIPIVIQEQNNFPGVTNRILGRKAACICTAFDGMERYFPKDKILLTGNPIREDIFKVKPNRLDALNEFGLENEKQVVFVVGGSQGARSINQAIAANLTFFKEKEIQLIWQTGKSFYQTALDEAKKIDYTGIKVYEFINTINMAFEAANVVVSRAGAIAISELCRVGKPAILVPFPYAAGDHQTKNAQALSDRQAAILISDNEISKELTVILESLLADKDRQKGLSDSIKLMAKPDAANTIATKILSII
ncbi:MAG: undecaprenyldiphospho-muramoylpentapeptide beta-N-acetylglucosaminyltransferase [Bacteroidota bacterium]|nr:undecaprenyldiphospho-muramoylpentapeptide beta-N-acetylglucosaminyltransferase [Bacteroidota bacterium]